MSECNFSNIADIVLEKSRLMAYPQLCSALGLQNHMELLASEISLFKSNLLDALEKQPVDHDYGSCCLELRNALYQIEDTLDNFHSLRTRALTKAPETPQNKGLDVDHL